MVKPYPKEEEELRNKLALKYLLAGQSIYEASRKVGRSPGSIKTYLKSISREDLIKPYIRSRRLNHELEPKYG